MGCRCADLPMKEKKRNWYITVFKGNYSHFNPGEKGSSFARSDYSEIKCGRCEARWRSKSKYVAELMFEEQVTEAMRKKWKKDLEEGMIIQDTGYSRVCSYSGGFQMVRRKKSKRKRQMVDGVETHSTIGED